MKADSKAFCRGEVGLRDNTYGDVRGEVGALHGNPRYGAVAHPQGVSTMHEPQYLHTGVEAAATVLNIEIPLALIKNTIFALDKDFFFGETMMLKFIWNDREAWGFKGGGTGDPTNPAANIATIGANIAITKLGLYLALEKNPVICAGLVSKVASQGLQTIIPFVYSHLNTTTPSTSQNVAVRFSGAQGRYLKKIYHVMYDTAVVGVTRYLASNEARTMPSVFHTSLNNERLQEFDQQVADNDDWSLIRSKIKGTLMDDLQVYRYNWCVLEKFDGDGPDDPSEVIDSGLPLSTELKYDFTATTGATAYNHYTFAVITRMLSITPSGIILQ
jgi:hypothetical protein